MITRVCLEVELEGNWEISAEQVASNVEELLSKNGYSVDIALTDFDGEGGEE